MWSVNQSMDMMTTIFWHCNLARRRLPGIMWVICSLLHILIEKFYLITRYNIEELCAYTNICIYFYFSDLLGPCSIYWRNQWCDSRQMAVFLTFWWHLKSALWYTVKFIYSKATSMCIYVVLQRKKSVSPQWRFLKKNK